MNDISKNPITFTTSSNRLRFTILIVFIISILLSIRIIYLISADPSEYIGKQSDKLSSIRGDIYDRNGVLLAVSDELFSIYAHPKEIKSDFKNDYSIKLSQILSQTHQEIFNKLNSQAKFVWLARQVSYETYILIKQLNLKHIGIEKEYKRIYPNENTASHILGFCNIDQKGLEGLEKSYDSILLKESSILTDINIDTNNIVLTIDSFIQMQAEKALKRHMLINNADTGTLIIMDGTNGEILAMAGSPDFNPNTYNLFKQSDFRNPAIFNQYEPGSVQKIFSLAAVVDINPHIMQNSFYCDGEYEKNGTKVKCTGNHGWVGIGEILKYSCNDGTLQALESITSEQIFQYLYDMDFGKKTGLDLIGEQTGVFRDIKRWSARSRFAIPIGQELSVNAMQIAKASTIFLNNGNMLQPIIIKGVFTSDGKPVLHNKRTVIRNIIKPETAGYILRSMQFTTQSGGTDTHLKVEGINFLAKSGTAQIFDVRNNKYSTSEVTSSLITFFPANSPKYIVYGFLEKPKGQTYWGGIIVASMISEFITNISSYIPVETENSYEINNKLMYTNKQINQIEDYPFTMPDLKGLSTSEVLFIFSKVRNNIIINGQSGTVYNQSISTGAVVKEKMNIEISIK